MKKTDRVRSRKKDGSGVIRLKDLAPRKPVIGGAAGLVFGERGAPLAEERPVSKKEEAPHGKE